MGNIRVLIVEDEPVMRGVYADIFNAISKEKEKLSFTVDAFGIMDEAKEAIQQSVRHNREYHLALLDMRIPDSNGKIFEYGKTLGESLRKSSPSTKLVIITSLTDNHLFYKITKGINPEGFMIKTEITYDSLKLDILLILQNKIAYTKGIVNFLRSEAQNNLPFDDIDREILNQLSNGIPLKEMSNFVPLSLSGIERRKRKMILLLDLPDSLTKTLLEAVRKLGII